jgi:hypothetical protein
MSTKDDDKDKEPEITPVGPGVDEEEVHEESDEREVSKEATSEDDDEEDERVGRSEDDEEDDDRDRIKSKRRNERKKRRERDKNNRIELNFLRQRNEQLERRFSEVDSRLDQTDVGNIDSRIGMLDQQITEAERVHAQAINEKNGGVATEALQIRDQLRDEKAQLMFQKGQKIQSARQRQQAPQQMDPAIKRNVEGWLTENDWFDPQLQDEDSRIARAIEDSMYAEGRLDARSPEYWEEYNRRLAKRGLGPKARRNGHSRDRDRDDEEDFEDEDDDAEDERPKKRQAKGPRITTGGRDRPLKKGEVYISAERRDAMEKAGVWDKPELRNRYLRQYAEYDRQHRGDNRRR